MDEKFDNHVRSLTFYYETKSSDRIRSYSIDNKNHPFRFSRFQYKYTIEQQAPLYTNVMDNVNKCHRDLFSAIFGTIFGLIIVVFFDYNAIMDKGFFQGYTTIVWIVIFLQVILDRNVDNFSCRSNS
jgi:hypothetical protein